MTRQKWFWHTGVIVLIHSFALFGGCDETHKDDANGTTTQIASPSTELGQLLSGLSSSNNETKHKAIEQVFAYQVVPSDRILIPQMIDLLKHDDSGVQMAILCVLGGLGKDATKALPAVKACLNSHDKMVRGWAQETIDEIENPKAANTKENTKAVGPAASK